MIITPVLLFLCTGNYYRSRFAELLFNQHATSAHLPWCAESRGIALDLGVNNRGPISPSALAGLRRRGITLGADVRFPQQVQKDDFLRATRIIALDETEHRPLLMHRFPAWVDRVEFWHVPDVPRASAPAALATMDTEIHHLIRALSQ